MQHPTGGGSGSGSGSGKWQVEVDVEVEVEVKVEVNRGNKDVKRRSKHIGTLALISGYPRQGG